MKLLSFISYTPRQNILEKDVNDYVKRRLGRMYVRNELMLKEKKKETKIEITDHALERWNQRIGPEATYQLLKQWLKQLQIWDRITLKDNQTGYIDNDILFTYQWKNRNNEEGISEISIDTFYGRISENISLLHFQDLRKYNATRKEWITLEKTKESLEKQTMPILPTEAMYFKTGKTKYLLERYTIQDGDEQIVITTQGGGKHFQVIQLTKSDIVSHEQIGEMPFIYMVFYWWLDGKIGRRSSDEEG